MQTVVWSFVKPPPPSKCARGVGGHIGWSVGVEDQRTEAQHAGAVLLNRWSGADGKLGLE
eukprot:5780297-Pleurochrysis_carterae.AAC.1